MIASHRLRRCMTPLARRGLALMAVLAAGLAVSGPVAAGTPAELLVNGGFEQGTTQTGCFGPLIDAGLVDGWETTDPQNVLEYWSTDAGNCAGFSSGAPQTAYAGTYWNELNATSVGTGLYQDIITVPGTKIRWSVAHRARGSSSTDVMQVILGAGCGDGQNGLTALVPDTYNSSPTGRDPQTGSTSLSDGSGSWGVWSGEYTVPAGQWFTRISFNGVSSTLGSGAGNFIDAVSVIGEVAPATIQPCEPLLKITTTSGRYGNPLTLATAGGLGSGEVTYVVDSGPCTVESGVLIATGAGDCYLTATKASDGTNPETASDSTKITIAKARPLCLVIGYDVTYTGNKRTAKGSCVGVEGDGALTGLDLTGTEHTNAGTYNGDPWTFTDTSGDYLNASGTVDNVIGKAIPDCSITPYSVTYDTTEQTATGACLGVDGSVLTGLDLTGTEHTDAGSYPSDPWSFTDTTGNYRNRSGTVANRIAKAWPDCDITPYSVTYDATEHTATGTCTGIGADGDLGGLDLSATAHTNAGIYANDAWTFTDAGGNYRNRSGKVLNLIEKAEQAPLTVDQTDGITGVPLVLTTSGGSGTGAVTYHVETGPCRIDGKGRLRASAAGECTVELTKAGDGNHLPATVVATITFVGDGITSISLVTTTLQAEYAQTPGGTLDFRYLVTNDGDVPLAGPVTIDDPAAADAVCPALGTVGDQDDVLDPGEEIECAGSHVVDQGDIEEGRIARTVTASAGDEDVFADASEEVTIRVAPTFLMVVDRSGSVGLAARTTIDRYNRILEGWQEKSRLAPFSLTFFNTEGIFRRYVGRRIETVPPLTPETFRPAGGTNLYDALATEIRRLRDSGPYGRVTVGIITDGRDTASVRETRASVSRLITRMKRQLGWTFVYGDATIATMRSVPAEEAGPVR